MAQDILTESFDPIVELTTGADLMIAMVYAQELGDWDYSGMYTAVLKFKVRSQKLQCIMLKHVLDKTLRLFLDLFQGLMQCGRK